MKKTSLGMWIILLGVIPVVAPGSIAAARTMGVESKWAVISIVSVVLAALGLLASRLGRGDRAWGVGVSAMFSLGFGAVLVASLAVPRFLVGDMLWGAAFLSTAAALGALGLIAGKRWQA